MGFTHNWILLPNLGAETVEYARLHNVEGLIFSGGESLGMNPRRDNSEITLLNFAIEQQLPILGICRGLQLIYSQLGGKLVEGNTSTKHVATRHLVQLSSDLPFAFGGERSLEVNSFHSHLLPPSDALVQVMAQDDEGFVEGIIDVHKKIVGIMWHPERESNCSDFDRAIFNWLFNE
nr:gamma-glutamyl-gamma-aminobutyrate hydrolase family protein [Alteromonas ponticola]